MKKFLGIFLVLIAIVIVYFSNTTTINALSYNEIIQYQYGKVLGNNTQLGLYPSSSLVNDNGTIYFICGTEKVAFTNYSAFTGLGHSIKNVVNGDLSAYTLAQNYFINSADDSHPWCSWILYKGVVYYSHENGLIAVPTWEIFLKNGGKTEYLVRANDQDIKLLGKSNLPLLVENDPRIYKQPQNQESVLPNPVVTPTTVTPVNNLNQPALNSTAISDTLNPAEVIDTLSFFISKNTNKSLTGSHPLSQTVSGQTAYYVKWSADSYEIYSWDSNYIYLKEDHSGSPNPGSYTFSDGRWLRRSMQVGEVIDASTNKIQNFTGNECTPTTSGSFPYKIVLEKHIPNYDLGGSLGIQDVIVLKYDYTNGTGTDYEKSYYSKEWGFVKWELYRNGVVIQTSEFNTISLTPPTLPSTGLSCLNKIPQVITPSIPTSLNEFVLVLYSCILQNNNPDTAGVNYWIQSLQNNSVDIKNIYTQFYNAQSSISNDMFTKLLYRCSLFREVDQVSYSNVINGLLNNTLTRTGLVQAVLESAEFSPIATKLKALIPSVVPITVSIVPYRASITNYPVLSDNSIYWTTTGSPTSCVASGSAPWNKAVISPILSGSQYQGIYPNVGIYTYSITCTKAGVPNATATITVNVSGLAPTIPTSLSGLVTHLYGCILNNNQPDSAGFNFWLTDLQNKSIIIPDIFSKFFGYQSGITNEQFAQKLYGCTLFRVADQASYSNVLSGLTNNTLSRSGLVSAVLSSSEFVTGILPKLNILK